MKKCRVQLKTFHVRCFPLHLSNYRQIQFANYQTVYLHTLTWIWNVGFFTATWGKGNCKITECCPSVGPSWMSWLAAQLHMRALAYPVVELENVCMYFMLCMSCQEGGRASLSCLLYTDHVQLKSLVESPLGLHFVGYLLAWCTREFTLHACLIFVYFRILINSRFGFLATFLATFHTAVATFYRTFSSFTVFCLEHSNPHTHTQKLTQTQTQTYLNWYAV